MCSYNPFWAFRSGNTKGVPLKRVIVVERVKVLGGGLHNLSEFSGGLGRELNKLSGFGL
jgi:hypothetical protein